MKGIKTYPNDCPGGQFSTCIEWQGGDIDCLSIKNGDCLNTVVYTIAEKVCEIAEPEDLSGLSLQCLIDNFGNVEPVNRTLINVLQLLIDNECTLKQLIDEINNRLNNTGSTLILDLKCLAEFDSFGNQLPYDEQTVLQSLINELCSLKQTVAELSGRVTNLQNQVDNLNITPYVEPALTSCLYTNKPTSQAVNILATDYCNYQQAIGLIPQIQVALGLQPSQFNTYYQTFPNWTLNPSNAAQMWGNMQIVLADLFSRVSNIETNCCVVDCDSIKIGFGVLFENNSVSLLFSNLYGTSIPSSYTDCGSTFTIQDESGNIIGGSIEISNNYTTEEINLSTLTKNQNLTISVNTKFCDGSRTCQGCYTKVVKYQGDCCVITNNGSSEITIIYKVPV